MLKPDRIINSIVIFLFAAGFVCLFLVFKSHFNRQKQFKTFGNTKCVEQSIKSTVGDKLMEAVFSGRTNLQVFENYYKCNLPARGDVVLYKFSNQIEPVFRIIYGLPNDTFRAEKISDNKWQVYVNNQLVAYKGSPYWFEKDSIPVLKTYQDSGHAKLNDNEYLVFTSNGPGLTDSSNLGFVKIDELVGKAMLTEVN